MCKEKAPILKQNVFDSTVNLSDISVILQWKKHKPKFIKQNNEAVRKKKDTLALII